MPDRKRASADILSAMTGRCVRRQALVVSSQRDRETLGFETRLHEILHLFEGDRYHGKYVGNIRWNSRRLCEELE